LPIDPLFRFYQPSDRAACLDLFDANRPRFFAPNERTDYEAFLETAPGIYEVCLVDEGVAGAFGVYPENGGGFRLRWILLSPRVQRQGVGSAVMNHAVHRVRSHGGGTLFIGASNLSAPFFARFGARVQAAILHGWGLGMHRVDMTLHVD
jgi:GNAT superfamily N-acetyltransferase